MHMTYFNNIYNNVPIMCIMLEKYISHIITTLSLQIITINLT